MLSRSTSSPYRVAMSASASARRAGLSKELDDLLEVALEPRRGDQLEDPGGLGAVVPESVPLAARLEDQVAACP